jgi:son of sevenless-like protein
MRQAIKQSSGACLPYIGIFLTDLTFIEDGNKDYVYTEGGKELINFFKRQKQATIINELMSKQKNAYALAPVEELSDYMRAIPQHSEDDLYDMSLKAEAREES